MSILNTPPLPHEMDMHLPPILSSQHASVVFDILFRDGQSAIREIDKTGA